MRRPMILLIILFSSLPVLGGGPVSQPATNPTVAGTVPAAGYERVYQASCVIPHWAVDLAPEGLWRVRLSLAAVPAKAR